MDDLCHLNVAELPPGIDADVVYYTMVYIVQDGKILLGYKKRGFGKSLYNGFGGKVEPGETTLEAARRELKEEAGIEAPVRHCGHLLFLCESAEWAFHIDIFRAETYTGDIIETDEMRPQWFRLPSNPCAAPDAALFDDAPLRSVPFDEMWEGDRHWLPLLFAEQEFVAREDFELVDGKDRLRRWWVGRLKY